MNELASSGSMSDGFSHKHSFEYEDLIECANGALFGEGNAQLPAPPMLMFDRISQIDNVGGEFEKGQIEAELNIDKEMWFFECHFPNDPVMPGCFGLDALWQLTGFYLGWIGALGRGRALGVGEAKFSGQITPEVRLVKYHVDIRRVINRQVAIAVADGIVSADDKIVYNVKAMKVGTFTSVDDM